MSEEICELSDLPVEQCACRIHAPNEDTSPQQEITFVGLRRKILMSDYDGNKPILVINNPHIEVSDGFHTFDELYKYRMVLHMEACRLWLSEGISVVRSRRHSDGELCFDGDYFVVVADLPTGQVSNHYKIRYEPNFKFVPEVDTPPTYDGHNPKQALNRMYYYAIAKEAKSNV